METKNKLKTTEEIIQKIYKPDWQLLLESKGIKFVDLNKKPIKKKIQDCL